ncbi:MAG TPA: hypothetical protein VKR23_14985 [Gaiellaceae bacterium]|nr:hypothetical protein [Gaiellaceae bacterium]
MEIEITPEPTEAERAAILAALAEEAEKPAPKPWLEDDPLP